MAIVTPIGLLYSAVTRKYDLLVGLFSNVVILVSGSIGTTIAGYVGAEHGLIFWVYGFVAMLSIFIVGVAVIYVIQVCRYIISRGVGKLYNRAYSRSIKRENPLPKLISDFKNKHCTVIKIDHGGDEN